MNKEVLVGLRTNFDRPEHMKEWAKRLQRKPTFKYAYDNTNEKPRVAFA